MNRVRGKLTYANVISTLALFLVLAGGTAFAATRVLPKNSVGTKQLKKGSITAAKIKDGAITGPKINLSTLGTVPTSGHAGTADSAGTAADAAHASRADSAGDAATLGGIPPSGFLQGGGRLITAHRELAPEETDMHFMTLPGIGRLVAYCKPGTTYLRGGYEIVNESGALMDQTLQYGGGVDGGTVGNGEKVGFAGQEYVDAVTVQVATRSTPSVVVNLNLSFLKNESVGCEMFGQATLATAP